MTKENKILMQKMVRQSKTYLNQGYAPRKGQWVQLDLNLLKKQMYSPMFSQFVKQLKRMDRLSGSKATAYVFGTGKSGLTYLVSCQTPIDSKYPFGTLYVYQITKDSIVKRVTEPSPNKYTPAGYVGINNNFRIQKMVHNSDW